MIFKPLDETGLSEIVHLELAKVQKRLAKHHIYVDMTEEAIRLLVTMGHLPEMGARPLRRVIEQYVEDPLAEKLIRHPNEKKKYLIKVQDEKLVFEEQEDLAHTP